MFPCIVWNNHKNIKGSSAWIPVFLWKLGVATWEFFNVDIADVCNEFVWDGDGGLGNMWGIYYKCPDAEFIQHIQMSQMDSVVRIGFVGSLGNASSGIPAEDTVPLWRTNLGSGDINLLCRSNYFLLNPIYLPVSTNFFHFTENCVNVWISFNWSSKLLFKQKQYCSWKYFYSDKRKKDF